MQALTDPADETHPAATAPPSANPPASLPVSPIPPAAARVADADAAGTDAAGADAADAAGADAAGAVARDEPESPYRAIFEQAPYGLAVVGLDGRWLQVNAALARLLGRSARELSGTRLQDLLAPEQPADEAAALERLARGEIDQHRRVCRLRRADGRAVWLQLGLSLLPRAGRSPRHLLTAEDITARHEAEAGWQALRLQLEQRLEDRAGELQRSHDRLLEAMRKLQASELELARSEARQRAVLEHAQDAYVCIDDGGYVCDWNHAAEASFGWTRAEALTRRLEDLILPEAHRQAHRQGLERLRRGASPRMLGQRVELPARRRDGVVVPCELSVTALPHEGGRQVYAAFLRDISARKDLQRRVAESEQRLREIADHVPVLVAGLDREARVQFANRCALTWLDQPAEALVGRPMAELLDPQAPAETAMRLQRAMGGETQEFEVDTVLAGQRRRMRAVCVPQRGADGAVTGLYVLASDETRSHEAQARLEALATIDELTGLPNRRGLDDRLDAALARARRQQRSLGLLFLDMDRFAAINDAYGHATGDEVLKEFGRRIRACVRETDTVARLAGDEFVVLLEGMPMQVTRDAELVARKILAALYAPMPLAGLALQLSTSIGVAVCDGFAPPQYLLEQADQALYRAKSMGRNTYCVA